MGRRITLMYYAHGIISRNPLPLMSGICYYTLQLQLVNLVMDQDNQAVTLNYVLVTEIMQ